MWRVDVRRPGVMNWEALFEFERVDGECEAMEAYVTVCEEIDAGLCPWEAARLRDRDRIEESHTMDARAVPRYELLLLCG